jgi:hypothetical protein
MPIYVKTEGLREFRRDLRKMDRVADQALSRELRETGNPVLLRARTLSPRLTGELSRSLRFSVTQKSLSVYSTLPQAPVLHWGGTISPRGVAIEFPRTEFITRAVIEHADQLVEGIGDNLENAAERLGWREG